MAQNRPRYVPTFRAPTEYELEVERARRQKALAEALAQQEYQPLEGAAAPIPRAAPLVKALQGYLTARAGRQAEEAEKAAEKAAEKEAQKATAAKTAAKPVGKAAAPAKKATPAKPAPKPTPNPAAPAKKATPAKPAPKATAKKASAKAKPAAKGKKK